MYRILIFMMVANLTATAQEFTFNNDKQKTTIPFKLINNLIFIPVVVNGVELNFLLDSGVEETILFSLEDTYEVPFYNVEKVELRGLGVAQSVSGLRSTNNVVRIGALQNNSHDIYIILDQEFNFSSHIGIPVNGIIGYQLFKNLILQLDYDAKKLTAVGVHKRLRKRMLRRSTLIPITIETNKPYVYANVVQNNAIPVKLLVDTGSSDALWLFNQKSVKLPDKHFEDYLGRGFSGNIFGKRARVPMFEIGGYKFNEPIVAFPDSASIRNIKMVADRAGSVGGEILKRFTVVFDYRNGVMYLKKGKRYADSFNYNMSGIEIQHTGLKWVQETVPMQTPVSQSAYDAHGDKIRSDFKYKFELKPTYAIASVRANSPADLSGLRQGDVLVAVNNRLAYRYSLQQLSELLKSEEGKRIDVKLERDGKIIEVSFYLKSML